jgi:hypothetical protein
MQYDSARMVLFYDVKTSQLGRKNLVIGFILGPPRLAAKVDGLRDAERPVVRLPI